MYIYIKTKKMYFLYLFKPVKPVNSKGNKLWIVIGRTDAEAETTILWPLHAEFTRWKRPWCWEGLGAGGEGDSRGWDGWIASLTRWTWVWVNSGSWWWTGRPGMLWFMGSQWVGHDWAPELNWIEWPHLFNISYLFKDPNTVTFWGTSD